MTVLTLTGKAINWSKPPKSTTKVLWSMRTTGGKQVTGSFRTIAALDRLNNLAKKKFGKSVSVIQAPYNSGVKASAGTHDLDACLDVWIAGVDPWVQQDFFRANGAGAYYRYPPLFGKHIHLFILPPRQGDDVSKAWMLRGFKVGYLVDGGWSSKGRKVSSSQIADYYDHRDALASHAKGKGWFPPDIPATIFDLGAYIAKRVPATVGPVQAAVKPVAVPKVQTLLSAPLPQASIKAATNNLMALPKNKHIQETLRATPACSVVMVQEADKFHTAIQNVPNYVTALVPAGKSFSCFVLFDPRVWEHVSTTLPLAYVGHAKISLTRHIAVTILRHRVTGMLVGFISYHAVTNGNDKIRKRLRRQGDSVVRANVNALKAQGIPAVVGTDQNRTRGIFPTRTTRINHRLDSIYTFDAAGGSLRKTDFHHVATPSDHDALVGTYTITKK